MSPETLQTARDILHEIGLGGVVALWALYRMEKKLGRWFTKTNRRIRRLGVATSVMARVNAGESDEALNELDEDEEGAE